MTLCGCHAQSADLCVQGSIQRAAAYQLGCCKRDVRLMDLQTVGPKLHPKSDTIGAHTASTT